jgi:hypothetical protein
MLVPPEEKRKSLNEVRSGSHYLNSRNIALALGFGILLWSACFQILQMQVSPLQLIFVALYGLGAFLCFDFRKWILPTFLIASIPATAVIETLVYFLFVPISVSSVVFLIGNLGFFPLIQALFVAYRYNNVYGPTKIGKRMF